MMRILLSVWAATMLLATPTLALVQSGAVVAWSTYLRAGPGAAFPVLDEVEHDTAVTRLACTAGWCRVRIGAREGFVDQAALDLPAPRPVVGGNCTTVRLADDTAKPLTRLCGPGVAATAPPVR